MSSAAASFFNGANFANAMRRSKVIIALEKERTAMFGGYP